MNVNVKLYCICRFYRPACSAFAVGEFTGTIRGTINGTGRDSIKKDFHLNCINSLLQFVIPRNNHCCVKCVC